MLLAFIHVHLSAIREALPPGILFWPAMIVCTMDYSYLALKFLLGGGIIVGVTFLAEQADPKYGGILAAAPLTTTLAILFTYSEAGQTTAQQLAIDAFWFVIPTMLFLLVLYLLLTRYTLLPSFGGALAVWTGAVLVMNRLLAAG